MINRTQEEIMQNWGVDNAYTPLVSVRCITYNHEPYISQALDSFLMQKTYFPFEVIVHDDASTDKTADIIREYEKKFPKIIKPIYERENLYSKQDGSISRILNNACRGKYIALCEGDDYWTDYGKLSKCVEFLENNTDFYSYTHQTTVVDLDGNKTGLFYNSKINSGEIKTDGFLSFPHTSSYVYLNPFYDLENKQRINAFNKCSGWDKSYALFFLSQGKMYYDKDSMSCYRIDIQKGSSFMAVEAKNNIINIKLRAENELQEQIAAYKMDLDISKHYYYNIVIYELNFFFRAPSKENFHALKLGWSETPRKLNCLIFLSLYYLKNLVKFIMRKF